jgi:hypothetical protein
MVSFQVSNQFLNRIETLAEKNRRGDKRWIETDNEVVLSVDAGDAANVDGLRLRSRLYLYLPAANIDHLGYLSLGFRFNGSPTRLRANERQGGDRSIRVRFGLHPLAMRGI